MKKQISVLRGALTHTYSDRSFSRRAQSLNNFDTQMIAYGGTVSRHADWPTPLLFSGHLFNKDSFEQERRLYPQLTSFFYHNCRGNSLFDILSVPENQSMFIRDIGANLQAVKTKLLGDAFSDAQRQVLSRFKSRFTVAIAQLSGKWDAAYDYFDSFELPQSDGELIWYKNVALLHKFSAPGCTRLGKPEAEDWMAWIHCLEPQYCQPAMKASFLKIYQDNMHTFPDKDFFQKTFAGFLEPVEIESVFAGVANRVVKQNLDNELINCLDDVRSFPTSGSNKKWRYAVTFSDVNLCLGEMAPFCFDITKYGNNSSLLAFFTQFGLTQLCLSLKDQPNISPEQNAAFKQQFFQEMERRGWINTTGALVFPLDKDGVQALFVDTLQTYFSEPLPNHIKTCLQPQIDLGKALYDRKLKHLSGFVQHEAIAVFSRALVRHAQGVSDPFLHQQLSSVLKSSLQLSLASIDISRLPENEQDNQWGQLSERVVAHLSMGHDVLLPSGAPLQLGDEASAHAIYVAIRHLDARNLRVVIINGGEACPEYHREVLLDVGEMPFFHYKQTALLSLDRDQAALSAYIKTVLSFPYSRCDWSDIYENPIMPLMDHPASYPLQLMGSCAVHNLKYGLKALFGFSEMEMGDMVRSCMIGLNALSHGHESLSSEIHPLIPHYQGIAPVERRLKIKNKQFPNFDAAMKNADFKAIIDYYKQAYSEDRVVYMAKQLFSTEDTDMDGLQRFEIELKYDLDTKSVPGEAVTLQERYMTRWGWRADRQASRQPIAGADQNLRIYRTMPTADWEQIQLGNYKVLQKGHLGDFKQALRYFLGSGDDKVMVAFVLKPGAELALFHQDLAFPKKSARSRQLALMADCIGGDSFPECSASEGLSDKAIGIKSESAGESGFSIGIGGGVVSEMFKSLVGTVCKVDIS